MHGGGRRWRRVDVGWACGLLAAGTQYWTKETQRKENEMKNGPETFLCSPERSVSRGPHGHGAAWRDTCADRVCVASAGPARGPPCSTRWRRMSRSSWSVLIPLPCSRGSFRSLCLAEGKACLSISYLHLTFLSFLLSFFLSFFLYFFLCLFVCRPMI